VLYVGGDRLRKGYDIASELAHTVVGPGLTEIPPERMPALFAEHDVLLMPSREEWFGVAAAEAIASGRWVVAAAVGGLPEVVTDGVNGTLVSDGAFDSALRAVPPYDPVTVAATALRFGVTLEQESLSQVWSDVFAA
jgi:glycosyltransferase involved in cell wall biosynthesis